MSGGGLSKSRFQRGLQCSKALWLAAHRPELADPITERQQALFDDGQRVGVLARDRFPGGVLVSEDHTQGAAALARTRELLGDGVQVIYEAAFLHDDVLVRADVLIRSEGGWDLVEVKSSTQCKSEHITDTAVQTYVVEGAGLAVNRSCVMHLDKTYVYDGGDYDLERLFAVVDFTSQVRAYLPGVPTSVAAMRDVLSGECPEERIGKQCNRPYDCAYYGHCHEFLPSHPVTEIPRISEKGLCALLDDGIYCIADVPLGHGSLTALQREACEVVQCGEMRLMGDLAGTLAGLVYPVHCLDFETFKPALPLYPGTRVHQQIPFQWSDHVLSANGDLEHREFLFERIGDPRPDFVRSLVEAVDGQGSVVVYSSFENTILNSLATDFPEDAEAIGVIQARLFDLEKEAVKQHVRHPDFHGRTSIKYVLPALVDDLSYEGLAIQNGDQAMLRYAAAAEDRLSDEARTSLFAELRDYCGTDTLGMVRLLQRFQDFCRPR